MLRRTRERKVKVTPESSPEQPKRVRATVGEKRRETFFKWLTGLIALALLAVALLTCMLIYMQRSKDYKNSLENIYRQSYYDAAANMDNIETKLSKFLVAQSTPQRAELSAEIWRQSAETAAELGSMPVENQAVSGTLKFVNQLGDYVYSLNNKLALGETLTDEEERNLENLHIRAKNLNASLRDFGELLNRNYTITDHIKNGKRGPRGSEGFGKLFTDAESLGAEYPKLIYDGPFSDNLKPGEFLFLKGKKDITEEEAWEKVLSILPSAERVEHFGEHDGEPKTLDMKVTTSDGSTVFLSLSASGGYPLTMVSDRQPGIGALDGDEAIAKAEEFAKAAFGEDLSAVWYQKSKDGRTAYVNVAPVVEDVVYYTDLVKVKVSLEDGSVLGLESGAFLKNHAEKDLDPVLLAERDVLTVISPKINVLSIRQAVVPLKLERYCLAYEVCGTYNDMTYIIYVNAATGEEEQIFRTVDNEQGEMVV